MKNPHQLKSICKPGYCDKKGDCCPPQKTKKDQCDCCSKNCHCKDCDACK